MRNATDKERVSPIEPHSRPRADLSVQRVDRVVHVRLARTANLFDQLVAAHDERRVGQVGHGVQLVIS